MLPDTVCVFVVCQVLTASIVVAVDCPRGSCEILETAVRWSVLGGAGDLSDEDVPNLVVRGGPAKLECVAGFLHNTQASQIWTKHC